MRPQFTRRVVGGGKLPAFRAIDYEAHSCFTFFMPVCLKILSQVPGRRPGRQATLQNRKHRKVEKTCDKCLE